MKRRALLQAGLMSMIGPALAAHAQNAVVPAAGVQVGTGATEMTLRAAADIGGRWFGSALQAGALRADPNHVATIRADCHKITPEWALKWDALAPGDETYSFREADQIADFAKANGLGLVGHTLVWHRGVPGWAAALIAETRQWQLVRDHIEKIVTRYSPMIDQWHVVNEAIEPDGRADGLRNSMFMRAFGPHYIDWAFWAVHELAPKSRRFINEYGLEYDLSNEGQRRLSLIALLEGLKTRNVPIDGVGLQAHLDLRKGPLYKDGVFGLLRDISDLGLDISITELDVTEADLSLPLAQRDQLVADEVARYLDIVLDFPNVKSVSTWGLSDGYSWLSNGSDDMGINRGLPYDRNWRPKAMRAAIAQALER